MKWNEFFVHASIDYKRFGPINAIFTSPSNRRFDKIPSNPISLSMRFAFHSANVSFFSLKKPQIPKIRKDFFIVHRCEIAKSAAPSTPWAEGKNLLRFCWCGWAFRRFFSEFIPSLSPLILDSILFPRFLSLSLSRQSINRRNGLIDFISRSRCPQFQFSRACVFRLVEIHRRAYVVDRF